MSSNVLRFFAWRALGARIAFSASFSSDVDLLDPALASVGPGAVVGARCLLAGHYIKGGQLSASSFSSITPPPFSPTLPSPASPFSGSPSRR
jgi:hypothetical protein